MSAHIFGSLLEEQHLSGTTFSGGKWIVLDNPIDAVEPATGSTLAKVANATKTDIADAAKAAFQHQKAWANEAPDRRAEILRNVATIARSQKSDIVSWLVRESGSTFPKANFEVDLTIKCIMEAAAMPSQASGQVLPSQNGRLNFAKRQALGVVGVISPFNFPLYLAMRAVAPALAVGNSVVLKPDPRTSICGGVIIARLFELAGLPDNVLQMIPGDGQAGSALCVDRHVAMIQFTGSTAAGRKVGEAAGGHLKKVSLELGGKNSLIILDDADLELAVKNAAWSAYLHQGQICMSAGRILVHTKIAKQFTALLSEKASQLRVGNPTEEGTALGPLINAAQVRHALEILQASLAMGAKLEAGGSVNGLFFEPTVLSNVTSNSPAFTDEIFAPVAVVVSFDTDEEAVALANDTDYGLSAAIISASVGRALKLGSQLNVGLLHINDATVNDEVVNPFGGVGASGNGTSIGGPANWEEFTKWQWVTVRDSAPSYPI